MTGARLALDAEERNGAHSGIELIEKLTRIKSSEMPLVVLLGKRNTECFPATLSDPAPLIGLSLEFPHIVIRSQRFKVQILNSLCHEQHLQTRCIGECVYRASHPSAFSNVDHSVDATAPQSIQEGSFGEAVDPDRLDAQHPRALVISGISWST
jgi:hypothetical protein